MHKLNAVPSHRLHRLLNQSINQSRQGSTHACIVFLFIYNGQNVFPSRFSCLLTQFSVRQTRNGPSYRKYLSFLIIFMFFFLVTALFSFLQFSKAKTAGFPSQLHWGSFKSALNRNESVNIFALSAASVG